MIRRCDFEKEGIKEIVFYGVILVIVIILIICNNVFWKLGKQKEDVNNNNTTNKQQVQYLQENNITYNVPLKRSG